MATGRIIVLAQDSVRQRGLLAEHGLALWLEWGDRRLLFDTGQGLVLRANAKRLGVPLAEMTDIVLSHGHYDHTGGLAALLARHSPTLHAHPHAFLPRYARNADGTARDIAMPDAANVRAYARLDPVTRPTDLGHGLWLTGPVPRRTDYEDTGGPFFLDPACQSPDPVTDDQAAFIETPEGIVVLVGCAHAGVVNTLRYVQELTGGQPLHTLLGGLHLVRADARRLRETIAELRRRPPRRLFPGHCTGDAATARLWQDFPDRCAPCPVGTVVQL